MTIVFSDSVKMKTSKLVMIKCKSVILPPCWWVAVRGVRSQMLSGQCCEGMSPGQLLLPINLGCSQQSSLPQLGSDPGDEDEECHLVSRWLLLLPQLISLHPPSSGSPPATRTPPPGSGLMHRQTFLSETLINKLSAAHHYQLNWITKAGLNGWNISEL